MKKKLNLHLILVHLGCCILIINCHPDSNRNQMKVTKPAYHEDFIVSNGIKLHYLDWGGSGQALILIHGLGDSPYIFEDLASSLSADHRVIAYSRRGHCKSETDNLSFDNSTLVSDLKLLLDSLKIDKANLLGWSMGGNEITEFAIQYPDRTNKLIYFESGYDLSDTAFEVILNTIPKSLFPDSVQMSSLNAYRNWYHNFWFPDIDWNSTLETNLQASIHINPDSSIATIPDDSISKAILRSAMNYQRNYDKVRAPALVIYTEEFFHAPHGDSNTIKIYENLEKNIIGPWRQNNIQRIQTQFKKATIKTVSGSHASFIFLSKKSLIESINDFLLY